MNGFLGWEDPRQQAITAIAGGLLGGKGSFSSIAGQALLGGMDQYNRAGQYQAQRQEQQMRMDQYRAAQQDAVAKQLAQEKLLAQLRQQYPNDPTKALAAELAPGEWAKQQFSAPAKPIIEERFNPETGRPEKVMLQDGQWVPFGGQQAAPTGETPQLAKLIQLRDALPAGDPNRAIYDAAIRKATTHAPAPSATVSNFISPSTPGQESADKKYAADFIEFATGGYADVLKQIDQLREASAALGDGSNISGPIIGALPDSVLSVTPGGQKAVATKEMIQEVAQRNLRIILGAQFTEKEGERLISRVFNPRLGEAENKKRVDRLIRQISEAAKAKLDAARYFQQNGSLVGWQGRMPRLSDFDPDPAPASGASGGWSIQRVE